MKLSELITFYNDIFRGLAPDDYSNNGLQLEASEDITDVAFAVDASLASIEEAAARGAQLLVVHHGISWGAGIKQFDGYIAQRFKTAFTKGVSLFGMHLPLDMHPTLGNNAVLADMFSLEDRQDFFLYHGATIGTAGTLPHPMTAEELATMASSLLNTTGKIALDQHRDIKRIGIVSGGGSDAIFDAAKLGVDALFTGEFLHQYYHPAKELGLSVIAGGHYATETTGIRALMFHTAKNFDTIQTTFIDLPTNL